MESVENLSVEEIKKLLDENKKKVIRLSEENEQIDKDIAQFKQFQRESLQKIPEIEEICRIRIESLEKIRRHQRKLLSIYARFPKIIDSGSKHVISTDIQSLNRQLDNAKKRKAEADEAIVQTKSLLEELKQQKIELVNEDNIQEEIMHQREQDKTILVKSLRNELDSVKTLYTGENRMIEQRLNSAKILIKDSKVKLDRMSKIFQENTDSLSQNFSCLPETTQDMCVQLQQYQKQAIAQTEKMLKWWEARRTLYHLTEQNKFLKDCQQTTTDRVNDSFKSIEDITKNSEAKAEELTKTNKIISDLEEKIEASKKKEETLKNDLEKLKESFVPLPKTITDELKKDREQYQERINEKKSLEIDFQILSDTSPEAERAFNRLDKVKRDNWQQLRRMIDVKESIKKLKGETDKKKPTNQNRNTDIGLMQDPRVLLQEDGDQKLVAAGPFDILTKIIFEPANDDPIYPLSYLIMIHTAKQDIPTVVKMIASAYELEEYAPTRNERLRSLLDEWHRCFKIDFPQVQQLVSLSGWTKGIEFQLNDNYEFDDSIDIDMNIDIAFAATPYTLAQHLAYYELNILYEIPVYEFIGTAWTKPDKWISAPNLMKMTEHFNTVSGYIISSILLKAQAEERAQVIERWIEIMSCAMEILCFQTVFEVYGALCNPSIARLSKTWDLVSKEARDKFERMSDFTSPMRQFHNYKKALAKSPTTLVIPYIGPFLTNLVYAHDGNQSKRKLPGSGEEVPNIMKYRIFATILEDIMRPWGKDIKFVLNKKLIFRIKQIPPPDLSDTEAYQYSTNLE